MNKFITCMVAMLVTGMVWGQTSDEVIETYDTYSISKPSTNSSLWNTTQKFNSTKANLKHGVGDLIVADNLMYGAMGLVIVSSSLTINGMEGLALGVGAGSIVCVIASHVHRRRGLKRVYWGINGITIPLN